MKLSRLRSDVHLETEGAYVNFITGEFIPEEDFEKVKESGEPILKVRRWSYQPFQNKCIDAIRRNRNLAISSDDGDDIDVLADAVKRLVAKMLLVGWWGFQEDDGTELQYSLKRAIELFLDPSYSDFYEVVVSYCRQRDLFVQRRTETDLGNSPSGSTGS